MDLIARQEVARNFSQDRDTYGQFANQVTELLNALCDKATVHVISSRVKSEASFLAKSTKKDGDDYKYTDPLSEIEDVVGVRVVCYTISHVEKVCDIIKSNFTILGEIDKAAELLKQGSLGYVSRHFVVSLSPQRAKLPEYESVKSMKCEIQVRTVFQHAWAELEHRMQYKSSPNPGLRSRFQALAGLVQVADREFEGVVLLGNELINTNRVTIDSIDDSIVEDETEAGHKLSDAAYMFGIRPRELVAEERYDDAIKAYNRLIELQPNQFWHYVGRAKAMALLGDFPGVSANVSMLKELGSSDPRAKKAIKELAKLAINAG